MVQSVESLKKEVKKLKKDLAAARKELTAQKKAAAAAKSAAARAKKELKVLEDHLEFQPRALELLDNLTIAAERDRFAMHQEQGAAREFLDSLPADVQESFRDWHPNVRGGSV